MRNAQIAGGEIILSGPVISDGMAAWMWEDDAYISPAMVRQALSEMDGEAVIRINSEGGFPIAGEAIRSIIAGHPGGVRMIVEGWAASAASLIFMGASKREMTQGSLLMIHNPSSYAFGEADDLRREADVLDTMAATYAAVYASASGNSPEDMLAIMSAETWYSPDDAVAAGFATAVTDGKPTEMKIETAPQMLAERVGALRAMFSQRMAGKPRPSPATSGSPAPMATTMETVMTVQTDPANTQAAQTVDLVAVERARVMQITQAAQPFIESGRLMAAEVSTLVADGTSALEASQRMMTLMAARETAAPSRVTPRGMDETETRRMAMEESLVARLSPGVTPHDAARPFMDHSIVDMAAQRMGETRVPGSFGARERIVQMAFHTTSDFPALFESALNRSLANRYALAEPTYRRIARQRSYADFRPHTTVRVGDFPELQVVNPEGGEIKSGTFSEARERTSVIAYGVRANLSRQMLVNDSLNGIQQMLADRGNAVARFEDKTFYTMMLAGAGADGPTLLETARQVFNTTDGTKAGAASAISETSLSLGRAAMRKQKTRDGAELELSASILLVGPDIQTAAERIIEPIIAAQSANVNVFSGRLQVITTAKLVGNSWYLFADPGTLPCFEWGLLEGYTAPRFRLEEPFGVDGSVLSLQHDFGCGAVDYRGAYKNAGA